MSFPEMIFLGGVIAAFAAFVAVLAWVARDYKRLPTSLSATGDE